MIYSRSENFGFACYTHIIYKTIVKIFYFYSSVMRIQIDPGCLIMNKHGNGGRKRYFKSP